MPELPEVETTLRGIHPHLLGKTLSAVCIRHYQLRWPVDPTLTKILPGQTLTQLSRRGKYLLLHFNLGTLIIHLGMSGKLAILPADTAPQKHDHVDFIFGKQLLRYYDPRRFGAVLWTKSPPLSHPLLKNLGPEPLSTEFTSRYLWNQCQVKNVKIKQIIMDSRIVVGVGNIYANEALFLAGIHPAQPGRTLDRPACQRLTRAIKQVLKKAIKAGGTTLKDFLQVDGKRGYFKQQLHVYGRAGQACIICLQPIELLTTQPRATYFCRHCQPKVITNTSS